MYVYQLSWPAVTEVPAKATVNARSLVTTALNNFPTKTLRAGPWLESAPRSALPLRFVNPTPRSKDAASLSAKPQCCRIAARVASALLRAAVMRDRS
jgi:hypothetical protein